MALPVEKYAILVENSNTMFHFDCAPNNLVAFGAQLAKETGRRCLERCAGLIRIMTTYQ